MGRFHRQKGGEVMNQRQKFIEEMNRLKQAIAKTTSKYLKKDYTKQLKQMQKDLAEYDYWHSKVLWY